jgi:hypothetical protein
MNLSALAQYSLLYRLVSRLAISGLKIALCSKDSSDSDPGFFIRIICVYVVHIWRGLTAGSR